jgi:O-antigen/teichoic acid export membrane protein
MQMFGRIRHSRLARQFATLLGGRFVAAGIQAVSIYFLAHWSNVADFGMLASALGIAVTSQAIGDAGATTYIVRETAAHGVNRKVAYAELLSRLTTGAIALVGCAAVLYLYLTSGNGYLALLPMAGWIVADRSSDVRSAIARGLGDVRIGTSNVVLRRFAQLALFVLAHHFGITPPWAYSFGLLFGSVLILGAMWGKLPKPPSVLIRKQPLKHAFFRCRPYWIHSAATQLRNVDTAIVAALSGTTQAAYYGVGARLMTPLRMVPATLGTALLPHLVKRGGSSHKDVASGSALAVAISLPYLVLIIGAPWAVEYLGPKYTGATLPLQIMCAGLAGSSFISIFNAILQAHGLAQSTARISIITALLLLALVSTGSFLQGATGAAIGFMAATFIQAAMVYQRAKKDV